MIDETAKSHIVMDIKEMISNLSPSVSYLPKYGGELIMIGAGSPTQIGGIFTYANHVTIEFSDGAKLADNEGHLEGKGKKRRHLKFESLSDVEAKNTASYIQKAIDLAKS